MKKLESAKKSLRTAENRHESHMHVIRDLEKQLEEIEQKRKEFDGQVKWRPCFTFCSPHSAVTSDYASTPGEVLKLTFHTNA